MPCPTSTSRRSPGIPTGESPSARPDPVSSAPIAPAVEQPAIGLFAALGWRAVSALDETLGPGGTLGRETRGEGVLVDRLRAALGRFNPALPPEAIDTAVDELTRDRSRLLDLAERRSVRQGGVSAGVGPQ